MPPPRRSKRGPSEGQLGLFGDEPQPVAPAGPPRPAATALDAISDPVTPVEPGPSTRWLAVSPYDRLLYTRLRRRVKAMQSIADTIADRLPAAEPLMADLFAALYRHDVAWAPGGAEDPSVGLHRPILERLISSRSYGRLHAATAGDREASLIVLDALAGRITAAIPYEVAEIADREAELRGQIGAIAAERARLETPGKKPGTAASRKARIEEIAREIDEAKFRIEADPELSQLRAGVASMMDAADVASAADGAAADLDGFRGAMSAIGESDAPARMDDAERLELFRRLRDDESLRRACALLGRARFAASVAHRRIDAAPPLGYAGIEETADPSRALPSEMALLGDPAGEIEFLRRAAIGELAAYRVEEAKREQRGPIVILVDESASMAGERGAIAKCVAVAIADIANADGRAAAVVRFADARQRAVVHLPAHGRDPRQVADLLGSFFGGGTDFDAAFHLGLELVTAEPVYRGADLVVITDGEGQLGPSVAAEIAAVRADHELRLIGVAVGTPGALFTAIADKVYRQAAIATESSAHELIAGIVADLHRPLGA